MERLALGRRRQARYWLAAATIVAMVVVQAVVIRKVAGNFGPLEAAVLAATLVVAFGVGFIVVVPFVEQLRGRIGDVEASLERLEYSEARYRALFADVPVGIVLIDPRRSVILAGNLAAARKMGYDKAEALTELNFLPHTVPGEYEQFVEAMTEAGRVTDYDVSAFQANGELRNWQVSAELVRDPKTGEPGVWAVINDVTEVVRAFNEIGHKNEQLERSNQELTQFASVAAHDLQEPLRKVRAFGDRLVSTQADRLDDKGRDYIARMQGASARMQTLIDDLLTMSRVTTKAQPFEMVDLNEVAANVVNDLSERITEEGATVEIGELPVVEAEPTQMRQLFQNLIGNSLKYRREELAPVVRIWMSQDTKWDWWTVNFADNGIGFSDESAEKIFEVFERLVGRSEYPGNGVGLAICRKIVDRHGGEIVATGEPGRGATFRVSLPKERMAA